MALEKRVLTIQEAADLLQVNRITLYRMLRANKLPGAFRVGRVWRINREGLEQLAQATRHSDKGN